MEEKMKGSLYNTIWLIHGSWREVYNLAKKYGVELIKEEGLHENARVFQIEREESGMHPFIAELYEMDDIFLSEPFRAMGLPLEPIDENKEKIVLTEKEIAVIHKHLRGEIEMGATEEEIMLLNAVLDRAETLLIGLSAYDAIDGPDFDLLAWYLSQYEKQDK